ncbi:MAG: GIY-YIG nuclease family protein [Dehalococcoidia bacterium]
MGKTISIEFDGYCRDEKKASIRARSGIYCVYECTYNVERNTVSIHNLIYIGEAENLHDRIADHEKRPDWLKHVRSSNELCFSIGDISEMDRERAAAAMIFRHKPPQNDEFADSFPSDETTMSISGKTALLTTNFTVAGS